MRKEVFGLTRKELLFFALFVAISLLLIIFSSIKLIHKYYKKDQVIFTEIQNNSKDIAYLNELNTYALNIQRNSLNILVYIKNTKEVTDFKKTISINRDSLLIKLNRTSDKNLTFQYNKPEILESGLRYLDVNRKFIKMLTDSLSVDELSAYNLEKMRPSIRIFTDLIRKNVKVLVENIQHANDHPITLYKQTAFWLLLIGLMPYFYFLYRIIKLVVRMIFWELFP